jgi:hypothetical protein
LFFSFQILIWFFEFWILDLVLFFTVCVFVFMCVMNFGTILWIGSFIC